MFVNTPFSAAYQNFQNNAAQSGEVLSVQQQSARLCLVCKHGPADSHQRDPSIPKHRVRWNWVADLPFGRGKWIEGNAQGLLDKLISGWQVAGIGNLNSTYFALPTDNWNLTGEPVELYGYKYPIENCTSGACVPGYLWWSGYIPANRINSRDANGRPNGYMGVHCADAQLQ